MPVGEIYWVNYAILTTIKITITTNYQEIIEISPGILHNTGGTVQRKKEEA